MVFVLIACFNARFMLRAKFETFNKLNVKFIGSPKVQRVFGFCYEANMLIVY